eukprot:m.142745 g.142745  ORF g.142745 m.142745 type:complete len:51 (+) comp30267_c1_seq1:871-1023(+)
MYTTQQRTIYSADNIEQVHRTATDTPTYNTTVTTALLNCNDRRRSTAVER